MNEKDKYRSFAIGQGSSSYKPNTISIGTINTKEVINASNGAKFVDTYSLSYYTEKLMEKIREEFYTAPIIEHKCQNCGGTVEWQSDKHIFICPYCRSVYAIGTERINDRG